jgi:hypothetical protein
MKRGYLLLCTSLVAVACSSHGVSKPSAERAAAMYLEIHNDRDHEAARALWGADADALEESVEWLRIQVGSCTDFSPMRVTNDLHTRYVFECDRGQIELELRVDEVTGVAVHTLIGARGVEPSAEVRETAEQLVALANGEPTIEPEIFASLDEDEMRTHLVTISEKGWCRIDRVHLGNARGARFVLECSEGNVTLLVDLNRAGALRRFSASNGAADTWRNQS